MENEEYYVSKVNKYKTACGILRTRFSQVMEVLMDQNISNEEKINILSSEMNILANEQELSYEDLELYDDYSYLINHSSEYGEYIDSQRKER